LIRLLSAYFPRRTFVLGLSEACLIYLALVTAAVCGLDGAPGTLKLRYEQGLGKIAFVSMAFVTCMYYFDLYDSSIVSNLREGILRLVQVLGAIYICWALVGYIYPPLELDRGIFLVGPVFVVGLLLLWRKLFSVVNKAPQLADRALILGDGPLVGPLLKEFESRPELGLRVVARVSTVGDGHNHVSCTTASGASQESRADDALCEVVKHLRVNRIVVAMSERRGKLPVRLLLSLKCSGVHIQDGTDVYESITGKVPIESIQSGWLLFSPGFYASRFTRVYKRLASIAVSLIGLSLSLLLLPFVILLIKLSSRGPVFYRQKRVGRDGVVFYCYKFRTMRADAEADTGPTWASDDDPRMTTVGRFLRKSRLDEIPQLWNVLQGDMSLVGPRPERPEFVQELVRVIPYYDLRHSIRPGITGWAQTRYKYGSSIEDAKEKLRYDLFYIKNMSPGLDLLIFFQTIKTILLAEGAK
jgi:sugar transferase (PEP-CTERM system associated)